MFLIINLFINSIKYISAFVRGRDNNSCFCISCILALMACTFGKCFYITPYKFPGSTTISSYYRRRICYLYLIVTYICVQVAFVAIGATMVGSINFTKKKGDYVKKGDEVRNPASYSKLLFSQFSSLSLFLIGTCLLWLTVWIFCFRWKHCNLCFWKGWYYNRLYCPSFIFSVDYFMFEIYLVGMVLKSILDFIYGAIKII